MIPPVPKRKETAAGAGRYYQSAPVRVPMMERRRGKFRVRDGGFGYEEGDEEEEEKEDEVKGKGILPPHEIVARKEARTPVVSCSVLEGAGRTLKGRDLRMRVEVDAQLWRQRSTDLKLSHKKLWYLKLRERETVTFHSAVGLRIFFGNDGILSQLLVFSLSILMTGARLLVGIPSTSTAFSCLLQLTVWSSASQSAWKYTMAQLSQSIAFAITVVFVTLASRMEFSVCSVVRASVSCMDCAHGYDLSGIRVVMECNNGNILATATTNKDGIFEAHLPLDPKPPIMVSICLVKLLGANEQFYALKKNMVSQIAMVENNASVYTTATPLTISKSCSSVARSGKCRLQGHELSSSKTVNLPVPSMYGLPPTSFYAPLFPIIGIP
ncbi:S40-7-like protein [Drosera capensis]